MPIHVDTRENNRVIYFEIVDPWTLEDLFAGFAKSQGIRSEIYAKNPARQIHTFLDVRGIKDPPPLGTMRARQSPGITHPSRGEWIVLGANALTKTMIEMMLKLAYFDKCSFIESEDEAWAYTRKLITDEDKRLAEAPTGQHKPDAVPSNVSDAKSQ